MVAPTDMAPIKAASPKCPAIDISISPSSGTVMFATTAGSAIRNISRSIGFIFGVAMVR